MKIYAFTQFINRELLQEIASILNCPLDISGNAADNIALTNVKVFYDISDNPTNIIDVFINNNFRYEGCYCNNRLIFTYGLKQKITYPTMVKIYNDDKFITRSYITSLDKVKFIITNHNNYNSTVKCGKISVKYENLPYYTVILN